VGIANSPEAVRPSALAKNRPGASGGDQLTSARPNETVGASKAIDRGLKFILPIRAAQMIGCPFWVDTKSVYRTQIGNSHAKILVVGANGKTGCQVIEALRNLPDPITIRGFSRRTVTNAAIDEAMQGDLDNPDDRARAVRGVNAIVYYGPPIALICIAADQRFKLMHTRRFDIFAGPFSVRRRPDRGALARDAAVAGGI
jgi:hypothetical protein